MSERQNLVAQQNNALEYTTTTDDRGTLKTTQDVTQNDNEDEVVEVVQKRSSDFQSFMNSAKLCYGNAYLSIPNVFSKTGWLGGIILFTFIGLLNIYTMM